MTTTTATTAPTTQAKATYSCIDCGIVTHTDDLNVIGANCSASAFEQAHRMETAK